MPEEYVNSSTPIVVTEILWYATKSFGTYGHCWLMEKISLWVFVICFLALLFFLLGAQCLVPFDYSHGFRLMSSFLERRSNYKWSKNERMKDFLCNKNINIYYSLIPWSTVMLDRDHQVSQWAHYVWWGWMCCLDSLMNVVAMEMQFCRCLLFLVYRVFICYTEGMAGIYIHTNTFLEHSGSIEQFSNICSWNKPPIQSVSQTLLFRSGLGANMKPIWVMCLKM